MPEDEARKDSERLSVNINHDSAEVLRDVSRHHRISITETVRRAIGLLKFFEEAQRQHKTIYVEDAAGNRTQVQLI